jgi:hypothetical protein
MVPDYQSSPFPSHHSFRYSPDMQSDIQLAYGYLLVSITPFGIYYPIHHHHN